MNNVKYSIYINQLALAKSKLDLKDCAILDYLRTFCSADDPKIKKITQEEEGISYRYTWINLNHLIKEMPLLRISRKGALSERISDIERAGFIKKFLAPEGSLYIRLLPKVKELEYGDPVLPGEHLRSPLRTTPFSKTNSTNNISDKHNINNNIPAQGAEYEKTVADLIYAFKGVNPTYKSLFSRNPQRNAIKRLLDEFGEEKLRQIIAYLPKHNSLDYVPVITTPVELENKMGALMASVAKQKSKQNIIGIAI